MTADLRAGEAGVPTKAISIRAPWWWFILHGGKDIENRDWPTAFRGPVLIHASSWFRADDVSEDFYEARDIAQCRGVTLPSVSLAQLRGLGGCLVGTVNITDCVSTSDSPWFLGKHGFVLADAKPLAQPIKCKGALNFFRPQITTEIAQ